MYDLRPDKEIDSEITDYTHKLNSDPNNLTNVTKYLLLIHNDQNELQKRILERAAANSEKSEKITTCLTIISVVLTIVAIWLSYQSIKTDNQWQEEEIQLLKEIRDKNYGVILPVQFKQ